MLYVKRSGELIDHSYLHCLVALTLWHKMLRLVGIEWVATRNVVEMLTISYQGFGHLPKASHYGALPRFDFIMCKYDKMVRVNGRGEQDLVNII